LQQLLWHNSVVIMRKLSQTFFSAQTGEKIDLMNDWEIGGTQNKWVCPSDRHLQLRAQLKSGWSVRTATARSPTNAKQQNGGITEAEQEHIKAVLARAEAGRIIEQQRIGKMVDRLEKMRNRANGNGVTQCLICSTDFGLLASKSYAAMCSDCRKYVCQKNCGVETYDSTRRENVFLCKICSEHREVMWKKSGAWFYKEVPNYIKPTEDGDIRSPPFHSKTWQHHANAASSSNGGATSHRHRQLPTPPDQNTSRTKSPRPRITPSWVKEKVQSSMSIGSDDENASTSEGEGFSSKDDLQKASMPAPRRSRPQKHSSLGKSSLQRYALGARGRITDTEESGDSRHTTPSTSPRHSPSSFGDDLSLNPSSLIASDAKSIDSGVVPSDHSALVNAQLSISRSSVLLPATTIGSPTHALPPPKPVEPATNNSPQSRTPSTSSSLMLPPVLPPAEMELSQTGAIAHSSSGIACSFPSSGSSIPPPIPPRNANASPLPDRRLSTASSASSANCSGTGVTRLTSTNPESMEHIKQEEPTTSFMSSPEDETTALHCNTQSSVSSLSQERLISLSKYQHHKQRSPFPWRSKSKALVWRVMSERMSSTQSSNSLRSVACQDEPIVRRAISGTELQPNSDESATTGTLGSIQFDLLYLSDESQLRIRLIRAKNLKAMDKNGFSDPYVKFYLIPGAAKATKLASKTIEKSLNPEWNEEFTYYGISEEDRLKKTLRITVLDRDRIGSDFLGETRVALKKLTPGQTKKFNMYLEHAMPVEKAAVDSGRGKILVGLVYNVQQGSLFVSIKRCVELAGMDSTGFSDPYVKVSLIPVTSKAHRQKTSIKKRTLNPEFNETLAFVVPFKDLPKKTLQIAVYDHDVGKQDDYIGGILLSASAKGDRQKQWIYCMQNPGSPIDYWHRLELDS
uniref:Rabphilin-1 n=1 Tax=Parascaris univalens TaxID=6257 RepID=A0A915BJC1_PARUN